MTVSAVWIWEHFMEKHWFIQDWTCLSTQSLLHLNPTVMNATSEAKGGEAPNLLLDDSMYKIAINRGTARRRNTLCGITYFWHAILSLPVGGFGWEEAFQVSTETATSMSGLLCHTWGQSPLGKHPGTQRNSQLSNYWAAQTNHDSQIKENKSKLNLPEKSFFSHQNLSADFAQGP